jgi:CRISPR-associated protein (TIGR03984 family)
MSKQYGQLIPINADEFHKDLHAWLAGQMSEDRPYLLAHSDNGVIWGKRQANGTLLLSSEVFEKAERYPSVAVKLGAETLQEARVFGSGGELRLWRTADGFSARLLVDDQLKLEALPDEQHLLWHQGNPVEVREEEGFAVLREGQQGPRHAPPVIPQGKRRPALVVRHYVDYDDEGQAYIALSRLVGLRA